MAQGGLKDGGRDLRECLVKAFHGEGQHAQADGEERSQLRPEHVEADALQNTPRITIRKCRSGFTSVSHWKTSGMLAMG